MSDPKTVIVGKSSTMRMPSSTISIRRISRSDRLEGGEATEIAAQIAIPPDGGWGWVVVAAGFLTMFIVDGTVYTFGSLLPHVSGEFKISVSSTSIVSALSLAMYLMAGPIVSALINRFGFRAVAMSGSIMSSFSVFITYFATNFPMVAFLYGFIAGVGYCFMQLSSNLVVGFYFEKKRALAVSLLMSGASLGMMALSPINSYVAGSAGWRSVALMQAGLLGMVYFLCMAYRPVLSLMVLPAHSADPKNTHAIVNLPSLAYIKSVDISPPPDESQQLVPSTAEKVFKAVKNTNFPTALDVVEEGNSQASSVKLTEAGPSTSMPSKITLIAQSSYSGMTHQQKQQLLHLMSKTSLQEKQKSGMLHIEVKTTTERPRKKGCCGRCCEWEPHGQQSRPMYRDDAFYEGSVTRLQEYTKSMARIPAQEKTGFEYQMLVSRAAAVADIEEKRGVFTTAVRRVLATMLEPSLLRKKSFIMLSTCGVLSYMGFPIPFIFAQDKAIQSGLDPEYCKYLVSAISVSILIGRITIGILAFYIDPSLIFIFNVTMSGVSIIISTLSNSIYVQFGTCCMFGFFGSSIQALRSVILVQMYGLQKLTNSIGMLLMFCGVGSLAGPPIASALKDFMGYNVAFYFAGGAMTLGGVIQFFGRRINMIENKDPSIQTWSLPDTFSYLSIVLGIYLISVLKVLPWFMKERPAYQLKRILLVYNVVQVAYSLYLVILYARYIFRYGIITTRCPKGADMREVITEIYPYFIAKHLDLLDTVFFVLRKKENQVTFLHIFHHTSMVTWTWLHLMYHPTDHFVVVGLLNSFVHVLMYAYYGIASLGPEYQKYVWWKSHLTSIQLVQFILVICDLYYQQKLTPCPIPTFFHNFCSLSIASFFFLFMNFYFESYKNKANMKLLEKKM